MWKCFRAVGPATDQVQVETTLVVTPVPAAPTGSGSASGGPAPAATVATPMTEAAAAKREPTEESMPPLEGVTPPETPLKPPGGEAAVGAEGAPAEPSMAKTDEVMPDVAEIEEPRVAKEPEHGATGEPVTPPVPPRGDPRHAEARDTKKGEGWRGPKQERNPAANYFMVRKHYRNLHGGFGPGSGRHKTPMRLRSVQPNRGCRCGDWPKSSMKPGIDWTIRSAKIR